MSAVPVIAIDGPAASGKGTVAAGVARTLGFHLLDSGALYRLVAVAALRARVGLDDAVSLAGLARDLDAVFDEQGVRLDGADVTGIIRGEDVSIAASRVAVHPGVRQALHARQRAFARAPGLVADGRDMGTVVFPEAALKVFVTASPQERASRRHKQLIEKGISVTIDSLLREILDRDYRDAHRTAAPLRPAAEALILDTTDLTIGQAIDAVLQQWARVGAGRA